ncbi:hypothetical protein B0H14DRAFT_3642047 [Mycena olivaceomarginata]|nr:hypothetical protein B0H14DRAFT_3642047 [Mycena olivaceomarginata]
MASRPFAAVHFCTPPAPPFPPPARRLHLPAPLNTLLYFSYSLHIPSLLLGTASRVAFTCCSPPASPSRLSLATPASYTMHVLLHKHNRPLSRHPHHRRRRRLPLASHAASASQQFYLVACAAAASLTLPNKLDLFCSPRAPYPLVTSRTTAAFCMLLGL